MTENVNYNTVKKQFELGTGEAIDAYTKTESDNKFAEKTALNSYETTASLTTKLNLKADKTQLTPLATKVELDGYLLKADATATYATKTTTYTKTEIDAKITAIENRLTALETP